MGAWLADRKNLAITALTLVVVALLAMVIHDRQPGWLDRLVLGGGPRFKGQFYPWPGLSSVRGRVPVFPRWPKLSAPAYDRRSHRRRFTKNKGGGPEVTREQVNGGVVCYEDKDAGGNSSLPVSSFILGLYASVLV